MVGMRVILAGILALGIAGCSPVELEYNHEIFAQHEMQEARAFQRKCRNEGYTVRVWTEDEFVHIVCKKYKETR